ncbi:MAG: hypothetical protein HOP21_05380 [Methylotenera sp.]|nr:hypothetical protein [Methylotenera sp.]
MSALLRVVLAGLFTTALLAGCNKTEEVSEAAKTEMSEAVDSAKNAATATTEAAQATADQAAGAVSEAATDAKEVAVDAVAVTKEAVAAEAAKQ